MKRYFNSLTEAHAVQQDLNQLSVESLQEKLGAGAVYLSLEGDCPTEYCLAIRDKFMRIIGWLTK